MASRIVDWRPTPLDTVLAGFNVQSLPIPTEIYTRAPEFGHQEIVVELRVLDRATGLATRVRHSQALSTYQLQDGRSFLTEFLRSIVHAAFRHEVDEQILVDGERIFDPHRGEA